MAQQSESLNFLLLHQLLRISEVETLKVGSVEVETTVRRSAEHASKCRHAPAPALAQPPRRATAGRHTLGKATVTQH